MKTYTIQFDAVKLAQSRAKPAEYLPLINRRLSEGLAAGQFAGYHVQDDPETGLPVVTLRGMNEPPDERFFGPLVPAVYTVRPKNAA
jgi:hypothetical protein